MTTIRATCPGCGEVDLGPAEIFLEIREPRSTYRFVCPACSFLVEKVADRKIVALLLSAGVNLGDGRPAAPSVRPETRDLPPLTRNDVIHMHRLLRDDEFLRQFAEGA